MPALRQYVAIVSISIVVVVVRALLDPILGEQLRYLVPVAIVAYAAAVAGPRPALAATAVGALGTLALDPSTADGLSLAELVPALSFAIVSVLIIGTTTWVQSARASAVRTATDLQSAVAERDRALAREQEERRLAQRRAEIVDAMQRLSLAVLRAESEPGVAGDVLEIACGVLGAANAGVAVISGDPPALEMLATRGHAPVAGSPPRIPLDADLPIAQVARTGERRVLHPSDETQGAIPAGGAPETAGIAILTPIELQRRVVGVVAFGMPAGAEIGAEDVAFVETMARKLAQGLDRVRLEEARRRAHEAELERAYELRAVIDTIDDGLAVVSHGRILLSNDALDRLVGGSPGTIEDVAMVLGLGVQDLRPPRTHELTIRGDGGTRSMELAVVQISAVDPADGALLVLRDVTAIRAAVAVRDAFVGMLSHELRTPITVILGSAKLLERRFGPGDPNLELARDIAQESERMNRLIDDLLVLSTSEGPVAAREEPLLVHHVLASVVAREAQRHPEATFHLDAPPGLPPAAGDPTLLEQVVRNLLANAAKYAGPRPSVVVAAREVPGGIEVSVTDNGPGVPAEDQEAIFGIFYRSRQSARRAGGAGIGLYVCRRLVEAMGGRIWIVSAPGTGACFRFVVPTYAARVVAQAPGPGMARTPG